LRKYYLISVGAIIIAGLFAGSRFFGFDLGSKKPIYLGEFNTKSGPEETFGLNAKKGIDLAVEEVNAAGGIDGRLVKLISVDPQGDKSKVENAVKKFASDDNVLAALGEIASERSNWAARVAQEMRLPMMTPASTNPSVTEKGDYIFRACYIDPFQGYAMARFARDMNYLRVGVLRHDRSNYSIGLSEFFIDTFRQLGGKVVVEETFTPADTGADIKSQIAAIKAAQVEALFVPVYYGDAVYIAKALRAAGVNVQLLGGDGWDSPELLQYGGDDIEGVYFSNHFSAKSADDAVRAFVSKYHSRYDSIPDGAAAMGYDAANIVIESLRKVSAGKGGLNRESLRLELARVKDFAGVTGPITIDENRNPRKPIVILQARRGRFEYVKTVLPKGE
jgi:branched-chain amino acid transport system substrate-binding protein